MIAGIVLKGRRCRGITTRPIETERVAERIGALGIVAEFLGVRLKRLRVVIGKRAAAKPELLAEIGLALVEGGDLIGRCLLTWGSTKGIEYRDGSLPLTWPHHAEILLHSAGKAGIAGCGRSIRGASGGWRYHLGCAGAGWRSGLRGRHEPGGHLRTASRRKTARLPRWRAKHASLRRSRHRTVSLRHPWISGSVAFEELLQAARHVRRNVAPVLEIETGSANRRHIGRPLAIADLRRSKLIK